MTFSKTAFLFSVLLFTALLPPKISANNVEAEESAIFLAEYVQDMEQQVGMFTTYQDPETGSLYMAVQEAQLNEEFLYFSVVHNGLIEADILRGYPLAEDVMEMRRYFNRIEFVEKNTHYLVDPDSPLANSSSANISEAVKASVEIVAFSEDSTSFLINVDNLFLNEALSQVSLNLDPERPPHEQFNIGNLAADRSKYVHVGVYPENVNIRTDYVFENPKPFHSGSEAQASARATTITLEHSFVKMPDNDFVPRLDDHRVGYFVSRKTDLNSFEFSPYKDVIARWHLVKKDPEAALSEPVEPIVWWIENTTPLEYRDIMKRGVLAWNSAFEKAGFKNAIVVKIQPDDATWHPEDVRYNVIRWSNTPDAGFAFGPNHVNPRTGQILGGDVMFEHSFLTTYGFRGDVLSDPTAFTAAIEQSRQPQRQSHASNRHMHCSKGFEMQNMLNFAHVALQASNATVDAKRKIVEQMLMELMLHEVGHVLGLAHNMKASNLHTFEDVLNPEKTNGLIAASVMDYSALVIAKPGEVQGDFFSVRPGPYDDWAIQFGYDPNIEGEAREALLARSTEHELMFGNDADDMRAPGSGIDPRVNIWDMSSDALAFTQYQFELADEVALTLKEKLQEQGKSWAKLRSAMSSMITYKYAGAATAANFIGGVEVNRFIQGQKSEATPYKAVDKETQRKAMMVLEKHIFAPDAFQLPEDLIRHAAIQPRDFSHYGSTEDPKLHSLILRVQNEALSRLLNPVVLTRMTDSALYGNEYSLEQMLSDLTDAVFIADIKSKVNSQRRMLQNTFVENLLTIMSDAKYDAITKASAFSQLKRIEDMITSAKARNAETRAHRQYLAYLIQSSLDNN
jgi:hypothetical protein